MNDDLYSWYSIYDAILIPLYLLAIFIFAKQYVKGKIKVNSHYKYFIPALAFKLIGCLALCAVYTFYYSGGDVTNYFIAARTYLNAFLNLDFEMFWEMVNYKSNNISLCNYYYKGYGVIEFSSDDYYALFTTVISIPFVLLGAKSFFCASVLLATVSLLGLWKLYEVFVEEMPQLKKEMAYAAFFIPSVFFWGSGMLKDTYTISAVGFFTYGFYNFFIKKRRKIKFLLYLFCSAYIMLSIKPYVLFALLPGSLIWLNFSRLNKIRSTLLRSVAIPLLLTATALIIMGIFQSLGSVLGEYSLDRILLKAAKTQQDLIRGEQYGSNFHNIGEFEPTLAGISSKILPALEQALLRPYLWDSRNVVMLLSGIENFIILIIIIIVLVKSKFFGVFRLIFSEAILTFMFVFALFFAFSVGLTTANYGALVRLKIPCIPFFVGVLFYCYNHYTAKYKFENKQPALS